MGPRWGVEVEESLSMAARIEITEKYARAYAEAPKKGKTQILDQVVEVTGWNRDHASSNTRTVLGFLFPSSVVANSSRAALAAPASEAW
jgi:rv3128c-like protein